MGPFPRAILIACFSVLKWLCWVTSALLVILIAAQYLRNELTIPAQLAIASIGMGLFGWVCGRVEKWLLKN